MAENREQRTENREQRTENREQRIVATVDLSINRPSVIQVANCITSREDRGICKFHKMSSGVVIAIIKKYSR